MGNLSSSVIIDTHVKGIFVAHPLLLGQILHEHHVRSQLVKASQSIRTRHFWTQPSRIMLTYSLHSYSMVAATQVQEVHSAYFPTIHPGPPSLPFHPSNVIHTHIHIGKREWVMQNYSKKNYHDWNNVTILLQATYRLGYLEKTGHTQNSSIKNINICKHTNTI